MSVQKAEYETANLFSIDVQLVDGQTNDEENLNPDIWVVQPYRRIDVPLWEKNKKKKKGKIYRIDYPVCICTVWLCVCVCVFTRRRIIMDWRMRNRRWISLCVRKRVESRKKG